jgi:hypothetical protein
MSDTPTNEPSDSPYEEENQAMLEAYHATCCAVVRDSMGVVVQAHMTYPDGRSEMVHHTSPRDVLGPVTVTSSTRRHEHQELSVERPNGVPVTYEGHREVPESEQTWEIHLRPKRSPES